ncbi:PIN2/TERF1-interacting telomerase inhibitor 1-like isoform X2 [Pseudomyrmex gracilis]|uniref:PIN2/TERF1-interacting telomerase inhibitor 1-like isoform X2 n=1 Tax=Pseudomyrmex gracilis TaxID=219809 RepID=UPI000995CAD6|nr:PIN2/TERF1-interacting telomerase inhibitor 1-like isoform X2 [Pseudomyrmex gracilis]
MVELLISPWLFGSRFYAILINSNKLGQKMLEKMGWSKGKGLGINEQGITEIINVVQKNDRSCLGYSKKQETDIFQNNYDLLLKSLNSKNNEEDTSSLRGSKEDYFDKKMKEREKKLNKSSICTSHNMDSLESEKERVGFGLNKNKENILLHNFSEKGNYASEEPLVITIDSSSSDSDSDSDCQILYPMKTKKFKNDSLHDTNNIYNYNDNNTIEKYRASKTLKSVVVVTESWQKFMNQRK